MAVIGAGNRASSAPTRRLLRARRRRPRHAHREHGRGRRVVDAVVCSASTAAHQRHGPGRARDHVPRLPPTGLLRLRLGRRGRQAIHDGVDVINFSICGGADPYTDAVELAFLDAYDGRHLRQRVGRQRGPGRGDGRPRRPVDEHGRRGDVRTATSFDAAPDASNGDTLRHARASRSRRASRAPTPVVRRAVAVDDALPQRRRRPARSPARSSSASAAATRRVDKGYNVCRAAPPGMILYNPATSDRRDRQPLAADHPPRRSAPSGDGRAFLDEPHRRHGDVDGTASTRTQGDVMASFSSRGPLRRLHQARRYRARRADARRPSPPPIGTVNGPPGELFQAIAGTSMSSPHSAGRRGAAEGRASGAGPRARSSRR